LKEKQKKPGLHMDKTFHV